MRKLRFTFARRISMQILIISSRATFYRIRKTTRKRSNFFWQPFFRVLFQRAESDRFRCEFYFVIPLIIEKMTDIAHHRRLATGTRSSGVNTPIYYHRVINSKYLTKKCWVVAYYWNGKLQQIQFYETFFIAIYYYTQMIIIISDYLQYIVFYE